MQDEMVQQLINYRVWLRSVPGCYEQYHGNVNVRAVDEAMAREYAVAKLRTLFPGRDRSMWRIEKVETL